MKTQTPDVALHAMNQYAYQSQSQHEPKKTDIVYHQVYKLNTQGKIKIRL